MQIFASLNADGQPYALTGDASLYWKQQVDGSYAREDHTVSVSALPTWDATALTLNRVQPITVADEPSGQVLAGYTLAADANGVITATPTYAPAPPTPRRELSKLTAQNRLKTLGLLSAAWSALQQDPDKLGRWFLDGLNVYADDADLLALLTAIGCTADQIAQVTAA